MKRKPKKKSKVKVVITRRKRKVRPTLPSSIQPFFDKPMSKTGRTVVEILNKQIGARDFKKVMKQIHEAYQSLKQSEFIDAMESSGLSEHEAWTLWHSPPMG